MVRALILVITIFVSACGDRQADEVRPLATALGTDTFTVHSERPVYSESGTLREVLRIGKSSGADEYLFSRIDAFAVTGDGVMIVADHELRAFDRDGSFLRRIARNGTGPGEVSYVVNLAVSESGGIAVHDLETGRLSTFSPRGALRRQFARPPGMPRYSRDGLSYDQDERLWVGINPMRTQLGALDQRGRPVYARVADTGALVDTAFVPNEYWESCPHRSERRYSRGFIEDTREPYLPKVKWYWAGGTRFVIGCPAGYRLDVRGPLGGMIQISREWESLRVMSEEARFVRTEVARFPVEMPAYHRFWVAEDGRTWVWRSGHGERFSVSEELQARGAPERAWRYGTQGFDVFGPAGDWIGEVDLPENYVARPFPGRLDPFFRGDTIWAVTSDELGGHFLSRFVVDWPA